MKCHVRMLNNYDPEARGCRQAMPRPTVYSLLLLFCFIFIFHQFYLSVHKLEWIFLEAEKGKLGYMGCRDGYRMQLQFPLLFARVNTWPRDCIIPQDHDEPCQVSAFHNVFTDCIASHLARHIQHCASEIFRQWKCKQLHYVRTLIAQKARPDIQLNNLFAKD